MSQQLTVLSHHRFLGIFPHPDDESLAAGILLQRAAAAGAAVQAVFLTSGEGNTWPLRVIQRRWRVSSKERALFAARRESEALEALRTLGLPPEVATFLRWPDTQLTPMLLHNPQKPVDVISDLIGAFRPSHIVAPLLADHHPDHSAAAAMVWVAQARANAQVLGYAAHPPTLTHRQSSVVLPASPAEAEKKRQAISCHGSQMVFRRGFHLRFAQRLEGFSALTSGDTNSPSQVQVEGKELHVSFSLPVSHRGFFRPQVMLLWRGASLSSAVFRLPAFRRQGRSRDSEGRPLGFKVTGSLWRGHLKVQLPEKPRWVLVKVHRPFLLFEEAGFQLAWGGKGG